jgi:hypothetical protein
MILADEPNPSGTLLDVRLIGVIGGRRDRARPKGTRRPSFGGCCSAAPLYATVRPVKDIEASFVENLVRFWTNKNRLEGRKFNCIGLHGPRAAVALVKKMEKKR